MPTVIKEQHIQKAILDYLRLRGVLCHKHRSLGIYVRKTDTYIKLPEGERGISDIIGCTKSGRFLAIEVKRKGNKPTPAQLEYIERVRAKGGIGFVSYSLDDTIVQLEGLI